MLKRIIWAGDSTVKQNDYTTYPQAGIAQGLPLYLKKDVVILNFAENGRSTKSFIDEGRLKEIDSFIQQDDFFFIQFGHNDEKTDVERHTDAYTSFQENLKIYAKIARDHGAYPVFITSLYRRLFQENGLLVEHTHLDYPDAMIALGKKIDVPVIDLCSLSKDLIQATGDANSMQWFMQLKPHIYDNYPEGRIDNSHLQYHGAVAFAKLIADELRKLGGIYEELLLPSIIEKENAFFLKD